MWVKRRKSGIQKTGESMFIPEMTHVMWPVKTSFLAHSTVSLYLISLHKWLQNYNNTPIYGIVLWELLYLILF